MATITEYYRAVRGLEDFIDFIPNDLIPQHSFLVYTNDSGQSYVLRGGLMSDAIGKKNLLKTDGLKNQNLAIVHEQYITDKFDNYIPIDWVEQQQKLKYHIFYSGSDQIASYLWNDMVQASQTINDSKITYKYFFDNCHSTLFTLGKVAEQSYNRYLFENLIQQKPIPVGHFNGISVPRDENNDSYWAPGIDIDLNRRSIFSKQGFKVLIDNLQFSVFEGDFIDHYANSNLIARDFDYENLTANNNNPLSLFKLTNNDGKVISFVNDEYFVKLKNNLTVNYSQYIEQSIESAQSLIKFFNDQLKDIFLPIYKELFDNQIYQTNENGEFILDDNNQKILQQSSAQKLAGSIIARLINGEDILKITDEILKQLVIENQLKDVSKEIAKSLPLNILNDEIASFVKETVSGAIINFAIEVALDHRMDSEEFATAGVKSLISAGIIANYGNQAVGLSAVAGAVSLYNSFKADSSMNARQYENAGVNSASAVASTYIAHKLGAFLAKSFSSAGPAGTIAGYAGGYLAGYLLYTPIRNNLADKKIGFDEIYDGIEDLIFNNQANNSQNFKENIFQIAKGIDDFIVSSTARFVGDFGIQLYNIFGKDYGKVYNANEYPFAYGFLASETKADGLSQIIRSTNNQGVLAIANQYYHDDIFGSAYSDNLIGRSGTNTIFGYEGDDHIEGRNDDDLLIAGEGEDEILAGNGNDQIVGGLGNDIVLAGDGNDIIFGGETDLKNYPKNLFNAFNNLLNDNDFIDGQGGDDIVIDYHGNNQICGNEGNDIIFTGSGDDYIEGNIGIDKIISEAGDDYILGGDDNDSIEAGDGEDYIDGGNGNDNIKAGGGDDQIVDYNGINIIDGEDGNDLVIAGLGNDLIYGGIGNDIIFANLGDDFVEGGIGNDYLFGGLGNDKINGLSGDDVIIGNAGDDLISTGQGNDTIIYSLTDGCDIIEEELIINDKNIQQDVIRLLDINSTILVNNTKQLSIKLTKISYDLIINFYDQQGLLINNDQITIKNQFLNTSLQDQSNHVITRVEFADNKILNLTKITNHQLDGVIAIDISELKTIENLSSAMQAELAIGYQDLLSYQNQKLNQNSLWHYNNFNTSLEEINIEQEKFNDIEWRSYKKKRSVFGGHYEVWYKYYETNLEGSNAKDRIVGAWWQENISGGFQDDEIFAGAGDDYVYGEQGNDKIFGGTNNDQIFGGDGDDQIFGGSGDDFIDGQSGDDKIFGNEGNDFINGNSGDDSISAGNGDDEIIDNIGANLISAGFGNDKINTGFFSNKIFANQGDDQITCLGGNNLIYGGSGNEVIKSGIGNDTIFGQSGFDFIDGQDGDDYISGGQDDDRIFGGNGNDIIFGDLGNDQIFGGPGIDFIYAGAGVDVIDSGDDDDQVQAGSGDDYVIAGIGNDKIFGQLGCDNILGGLGDDVLDGGFDGDVIDGQAGDDIIIGGFGDDILIDGLGSDIIFASPNQNNDENINLDLTEINSAKDDNLSDRDLIILSYENAKSNVVDVVKNWHYHQDIIILKLDYKASITRARLIEDMVQIADNVELTLKNNQKIIFENVLKSNFNSENFKVAFTAGENEKIIFGEDNNEIIFGNQKDNIIFGNFGNDQLFGELGKDQLFGNSGDDILHFQVDEKFIFSSQVIHSDDVAHCRCSGCRYSEDILHKFSPENGLQNLSPNKNLDIFAVAQILSDKTKISEIEIANEQSPIKLLSPYNDMPRYSSDYLYYWTTRINYSYESLLKFATKNFYNNELIAIDGYNRSLDFYDGGEGNDSLILTQGNDLLNLDNINISLDKISQIDDSKLIAPKILNLEVIIANDGDDIINLSSSKYQMSGITIFGGNGNDKIFANIGDDLIFGNDGNDQIFSGNGNDIISGGNGDDEIFAGAGDDLIDGVSMANKIYGEDGDDHLIVNQDDLVINGGAGQDLAILTNFKNSALVDFNQQLITVNNQQISFVFVENIRATNYDDIIIGDENNNIITGQGGNDSIIESAGNDVYVFGKNDGFDQIIELNFQGDYDKIILDETINFQDLIFESNENDLIISNIKTNDKILIAQQMAENPAIEALQINDKKYLQRLHESKIYNNLTSIEQEKIAELNLSLKPIIINEDQEFKLDNILLNSFNDDQQNQYLALFGSIMISSQNQELIYKPQQNFYGVEQILFYQNNQLINRQTIFINSVNDLPQIKKEIPNIEIKVEDNWQLDLTQYFVDIESDKLKYDVKLEGYNKLPSWLKFNEQTGIVQAQIGRDGVLNFTATARDEFEEAIQQHFSLKINRNYIDDIASNIERNEIVGSKQNDYLNSIQNTADIIVGDDGDDVINFFKDNDWLESELGVKYYAWNTDLGEKITVIGKQKTYDIFDGGNGFDILNLSANNDVIFLDDNTGLLKNIAKLNSIEEINCLDGDDIIDLTSLIYTYSDIIVNGQNGNDVLWTNSGNDLINGGDGDDFIHGGQGNDILNGDEGDDIIYGFDGDDLIYGANGKDLLYGQDGNDQFIFKSKSDSTSNDFDIIFDFIHQQDVINVNNLHYNLIKSNQTFNNEVNTLNYYFDQGNTIVKDPNSDFSFYIKGEITLDNSDFIFY